MKRGLLILTLLCLLPAAALSAGEDLRVEVLAKGSRSWDGSPLPNYPEAEPEVTVLRITIPAGAVLPLHQHPVINAGVLVSGQLTVVTDDDHVLQLKAGDALIEVVGRWHYGRNDGRLPAEIVVFYAGTKDRPISIKK